MKTLEEVLKSNPELQSQYELLLNCKKRADKALDEFVEKILSEQAPTKTISLKEAKLSIDKLFISNQLTKERLLKMVTTQQKFQQNYEETYLKLTQIPNPDQQLIRNFLERSHIQLEAFQLKCLQNFKALKIPLFTDIEIDSATINEDQKALISYIYTKLKLSS